MATARGYLVIFVAGLVFASIAGAEDFKCDQAARFGFVDALCDPFQIRLAPIPPLAPSAKPDAAKEPFTFDAGAARGNPANQAEIYRQMARANQRAWDNYGGWNPVSPVFPRGTFPGGEFSPLKFPPVGSPESSSPSTQEGRAIKH
jgi:hypothetical protein